MSAKRKYRSPNEYLKYLKGELSREERHSFERDLQADPFEMDAMEGMEQVPAAELEEDLLSIHADLNKRLKRRKRRTFYYAAASVASLLIVGTIFLNIYNINPKSAQEAIPKDETFMHEESALQSEADEMDQEPVLIEESVTQTEAPAPVVSRTRKTEALPEESQNLEEIIVHEEKVMQAARVVSDEDEAAVQEAEAPALGAVAPVQEPEAPVQEADELVVMEAQPKRSQKKGRAQEARIQEAPAQYSSESLSGIVLSSEDMEPLPGASIVVKDSDSGMVADMNGRFSLVADQGVQTTVIASYVGMETEEYQLTGGTENRVVMQPDLATLDEVVVIGYATDKETYATGAVQKVKLDKEELNYSGAEPEEGLEAYKMYIEEQIRFPAGDTISKREVVVLKFNVESDGSISRINTLRSPGDSFTEEAIRLVNDGPSWNPAKNENGPTDDVVRIRIVFKKQ